MQAQDPQRPAILSTNLGRLGMLLLLVLLLFVPLTMIRGVVQERASRNSEALEDVSASWGGTQSIAGPVLRLHCLEPQQIKDEHGWTQQREQNSTLYLLPDELNVEAVLHTEVRRRGLFDVPVYTARLTLHGRFPRPDRELCPGRSSSATWNGAELLVGLSGPRGLHADTGLIWNGTPLELKPATGADTPALASGVHATLGAVDQAFNETVSEFTLSLGLNGAQSLQLAPVAKQTRIRMDADWAHPSFYGAWLPTERSISADTFSAQWSISYLGRDYPQLWQSTAAHSDAIERSMLGVSLLQPVDRYVMAERVTKYAALTVVFTFLTVWLTEVLSARRVHPIQYGFIGSALCLFGLLQLALAEHIGFTPAFVLAVLAVTSQVTLYCRSVLGSLGRALSVGALLTALYGYLYSLLRAEDYALLGGVLALFALLTTAMYLTRRVDWSRPGT